LAAPVDILGLAAREPMIVEHPDGTLFVSGYGASYVSGNRTDEPTLWKSHDGGTAWARVNVVNVKDFSYPHGKDISHGHGKDISHPRGK
jgi:hypothetical protein